MRSSPIPRRASRMSADCDRMLTKSMISQFPPVDTLPRPAQALWGKVSIFVFCFGSLLRLALAAVNLEANDNHLEVIAVIADENRIPDKVEFWEAFQPKLYHVTMATLWRGLRISSPLNRIRMAQLVSCAAGIATLWIALRFLHHSTHLSAKVRCIALALVALNPGLVAINAQATNDSFVILFSSLSLMFGYCFFTRPRRKNFCWMLLGAILSGVSKGNGLVVFLAILGTFAVALLGLLKGTRLTRNQAALYGCIFLLTYGTAVPWLGS